MTARITPLQTKAQGSATTGYTSFASDDPVAAGSPVPHWLLRLSDTSVALGVLISVLLLTNSHNLAGGLTEFLALRVTVKNVLLLALLMFAWPHIFAAFGLYAAQRTWGPRAERYAVVAGCTFGTVVALLFLATSSSGAFGLTSLGLFWIGTIGMTLATRHGLKAIQRRANLQGRRQVLIVGSGPRAAVLYRKLQECRAPRYTVMGFVDSNPGVVPSIVEDRLIGRLDDLESLLVHETLDEVLIALPVRSCYSHMQATLELCERMGVKAKFPADVFCTSLATARYEGASELAFVAHTVAPDDFRLVVKRAVDVCGALFGLLLLGPALAFIAGAIKLTSPGPVIFVQLRYGYQRRRFRMYKFRTMVAGAEDLQTSLEHMNEAAGPVFKIRKDPRLTSIGAFLRRTSLDELPQLINVLRGDMSLVGPRPLPVRDVNRFSEAALMRRFSVKPGLTCLWQIRGRADLGFDEWIALDLKYIDEWSLSRDWRILLATLPAILRGTGAH